MIFQQNSAIKSLQYKINKNSNN
ncbi:uncharacterized protein METZ01_LOCUS155308 [marine metagenome]|uniref:Uncharacterized protein n=1 Tax=marine metagenome TaxID=408172 RepID=A0A382AM44_9ZZZZ